LASKGYDKMLNDEIEQHEAASESLQLFAAKPKHVRPIERETVKSTVKQPRVWKFIINY